MADDWAGHRCWTIGGVQHTVFGDIASLGLDADAVFLAAHTTLSMNRLKGATQHADSPELDVLHSLTASIGIPDQNTIIAITGKSGSGKSHLVRWVRAHLDDTDDRYHVVYVPRELATLRELIGRVLDALPDSNEKSQVRDQIERAVTKKSSQQFAEELLDRVRSVLSYELADTGFGSPTERTAILGSPSEADSGRRENGLGDLMLAMPLRRHLLRSGGAIQRVVESLRGKRTGGDEELPEFDQVDLQPKMAGVEGAMANLQQKRLWNKIQRQPAPAVDLLNEALPRAVAETLGMGPEVNLGQVFNTTRRTLRQQGQELVLLFEDLALFGLFDGELFEQFVLQPGPDLAPIRAVFAITDGKFRENVPDTVQTRLAHHFEAGVVDLRDPQSRDQAHLLAARYLNIARVGRERLIEAWADATVEMRLSREWVPNGCWDYDGRGTECPHRSTCHAAFDDVEEIGLYPYNARALDRAIIAADAPLTPRAIVDEFVRDFLVEAWAELESKEFPSDDVRSRFDFSIDRPKGEVVPTSHADQQAVDRLHRARVIWADGNVEHPGITEAFVLPGLGDVEDDGGGDGASETQHDRATDEPPPRSRPRPLTPVFDWENGTPLPEGQARFFREFLFKLTITNVDFDLCGAVQNEPLTEAILREIVVNNSFEFTEADPGRTVGKGLERFLIAPDSRGVKILSAVRWFADHGHWRPDHPGRLWDFVGNMEQARLELEVFIDRCRRSVERRLEDIISRGSSSPAALAVEFRTLALLCLGVPLGAMAPAEALRKVLDPDTTALSSAPGQWPSVISAARRVLDATSDEWVRAFGTVRQGDTGEPQVVDSQALMLAVESVVHQPLAERRPNDSSSVFEEMNTSWARLVESLHAAVEAERARIVDEVAHLRRSIGESSISELTAALSTAGRLAVDETLFRPLNTYGEFRSACDELQAITQEDVNEWFDKVDRLAEPSEEAHGATVHAQTWAPHAIEAASTVRFIQKCLAETETEATSRLSAVVGDLPGDILARVARGYEEIADLLDEAAGGEGGG